VATVAELRDDAADINVRDSIFQNHHAVVPAGDLYGCGTLSFDGAWAVVDNEASISGGALAIVGTANAGFR